MAHTPGPWFASEPYTDDYDVVCVDVGPLAQGQQYEDAICTVMGANHDAEGNARLIAAAPDLYAACQAILKTNDAYDLYRVISQAREAVEKAESGSLGDG